MQTPDNKIFQGRDYNRERVRMRDKHTCQLCSVVWKDGERRFDIHHKKGLCGKKSRGYDKLSDLHLLVTLCHQCHSQNHGHNKGPVGITAKQATQMAKYRDRGWTYGRIANKYGISYAAVQYHLVRRPLIHRNRLQNT